MAVSADLSKRGAPDVTRNRGPGAGGMAFTIKTFLS